MYTYARERHESVSKIWEPQQPPVKEEDEVCGDYLLSLPVVCSFANLLKPGRSVFVLDRHIYIRFQEPPADTFEDVIDTGQIAIEDQGKLFDCLETMRSVIGDSVPEAMLREAAISQNFDADKALNVVFDRQKNPSKPRVQAGANPGEYLRRS